MSDSRHLDASTNRSPQATPASAVSAHRAAGPVDAAPKTRRTSVADSPRRQARLRAYIESNLDPETASSLATSWTQADSDTDRGQGPEKIPARHESALVQQWLEKTGLNSLDQLRDLIDQATLDTPAANAILAAEAVAETSPELPPESPKEPASTAATAPALPAAANQPPHLDATQQTIAAVGSQNLAKEPPPRRSRRSQNEEKPLAKNQSGAPQTQPPQLSQLSQETPAPADTIGQTFSEVPKRPRAARNRDDRLKPPTQAHHRARRLRIFAVILVCVLVAVAGITLLHYYTKHADTTEETTSQVQVLGALGTEPVVSVNQPLPLSEKQSKVLIRGSGVTLEDNHNVLLRISVFSGQDGHLLGSPADSGIVAGKFSPAKTGSLIYEAVKGKPEGSRILITQPVKNRGHSQMEIDVVDVLYSQARGEVQELPPDFPIGISTTSARPVPEHRGPFTGDLVVAPLIKGDGAKVTQGQRLLVNYLEYSYADPPALLQDRWDGGGVRLVLGESVQSGIVRGLVDQSVGSRVVMLVPPAEGTGTSATIVIADILAAWDQTK